MIPKTINYIPFLDRYSSEIQEFTISIRATNPEYTIKEWTLDILRYERIPENVKDAIIEKRYDEVSEYLALYLIYSKGGIYINPRVKITKSLDGLLYNGFFGFYDNQEGKIQNIIMGAEKGNPFVLSCLERYFDDENVLVKKAKALGFKNEDTLQHLADRVSIYPSTFISADPDSYAYIKEVVKEEAPIEKTYVEQSEEHESKIKRLLSIFSKKFS